MFGIFWFADVCTAGMPGPLQVFLERWRGCVLGQRAPAEQDLLRAEIDNLFCYLMLFVATGIVF